MYAVEAKLLERAELLPHRCVGAALNVHGEQLTLTHGGGRVIGPALAVDQVNDECMDGCVVTLSSWVHACVCALVLLSATSAGDTVGFTRA